jgi:hypothetical protein
MTESEMIAWFVYGLPSSMRKSCSTDAHGRDWKSFDDLISYATGQEIHTRVAAIKTATANLSFAKTSCPKSLKKQGHHGRSDRRSKPRMCVL